MTTLYAAQNLPRRLEEAMTARNLSYRKAAPLIGISPATVHRIDRGRMPDTESYLRVRAWLEVQERVGRAAR